MMPIDTTKVTGRRALHFHSLHDLLTDAERLAAGEVEMLGNWSLGQIFAHLATAINGSIDGFSFSESPLFILFVRLFLKKRLLTKGIPPGLGQAPKWDPVKPGPTSVTDGLTALRAAIARYQSETRRATHPGMGKLTAAEWDHFHLRHAEHHMSFARPN